MKRLDKTYVSAWVLLSVFIPMVLLSSLHIHPELLNDPELCPDCIEHTVHNGHITTVKGAIDCPLCAFQASVYQSAEIIEVITGQQVSHLVTAYAMPSVTIVEIGVKQCRAPPVGKHA